MRLYVACLRHFQPAPLLLPVLLLCWYTTCLQCILLRLTCGRVQYSPVVGASGQLAILGHPLTRAPAQILTAQVNLDIWLNISPGVLQHLDKGAINKNRPNECWPAANTGKLPWSSYLLCGKYNKKSQKCQLSRTINHICTEQANFDIWYFRNKPSSQHRLSCVAN